MQSSTRRHVVDRRSVERRSWRDLHAPARFLSYLARMHVPIDVGGLLVLSDREIVIGLEVQPEPRRVAEVSGEAHSRRRRDRSFAVNDLADARRRVLRFAGQILRPQMYRLPIYTA